MEEKYFFQEGDVSVSNSRFVVAGQTFAMNTVTSVKQHTTKASRVAAGLWIFIGAIVTLVGAAALFNGESFWTLVVGAVITLIAIGVWGDKKDKFAVVLSTASGENQALESTDKEHIATVISALNNAIISRG